MAQSQAVAVRNMRMPASLTDFDERKWRVLTEAIFPAAKTPEAVMMAIDYCKARNLDIFRKPVHIVPMWNSSLGREVETVWPGINEVQVTAARTGQYAGMDEPKWGEIISKTFKGRVKDKKTGQWKDDAVTVEFPEYCAVTVYRMVNGQRCPFTEPVYWIEAYSRAFGTELPTAMWIKRPRGQLHKVGKAASLRTAFPEEGEYTAEEMEGKEIEHGGVVIENAPQLAPPSPPPAPKTKPNGAPTALSEADERALDRASYRDMAHETPDHDAETGEIGPRPIHPEQTPQGTKWTPWGTDLIAAFKSAKDEAELSEWLAANTDYLDVCETEAAKVAKSVVGAYQKCKTALIPADDLPEFLQR